METRFARRSAAARLIHVPTVSRFLRKSLYATSHLARPTPALKFIAALAAIGLFAGIPANALISPTAPVGATPGSFAVSPSGAATYTIPIVVAPGTNGMQPNLALIYNSQAGNGLLGMGWALSGLSVIHRCGATMEIDGFKGGVNYDANDRFCLDGERLIQVGATEFRTEHESFQRVFIGGPLSDPTWFSVWDKDGGDRGYGATPDSRIQAPGHSMARVWAISYMRDKSLNRINFSYEINSDGDYRPASISYSTNTVAGKSTPPSSVTFTYGPRSDVTPFPDGGFNAKRLLAVSTFSDNTIVRKYNLSYEYGVSTMRSRLTSITECGTDNVCLPPTQFQWQEGGGSGTGSYVRTFGYNGGPGYANDGTRAYVDVNGDGKADFCRLEGDPGNYYIMCTTNLGAGGDQQYVRTFGFNSGPGYNNPETRAYVDVNGGGKADFCRLGGNPGDYYIMCTTNLGSGGPAQNVVTNGFNSGPGYGNDGTRAYIDIDGDGKADFCRLEGDPGNYYIMCTTNLGSGGPAQNVVTTGFNSGPGYNNPGTRAYVDVNGDGKAD